MSRPTHRPYDAVKRAFDLAGATLIFLVTLPVQAIVAGAVVVNLGRPVLFTQRRPGRNGRVFTLLKFRSMKNLDVAAGLVSDADRLTRFGQVLRSTSLDELPSMLNVIRGDMSLVGPRPLLISYLEKYSTEQARRHEVRPGVTGLAQVAGRNSIAWDRRLALDVEYVDRRSLRLDLWILSCTVTAVLRRAGISSSGHATAAEFTGSRRGEGES